jgi:hypothetical protein
MALDPKSVGETLAKIKEVLTPLAERLGEDAEHEYRLAVKDVFLDGMLSGGLCILALGVLIACIATAKWWVGLAMKDGAPLVLLPVLAGGLSLAVLAGYLSSAVHCIFNPEYTALIRMLNSVTSK